MSGMRSGRVRSRGVFEAVGTGGGVVTVSDTSIGAALASVGLDIFRDDFTIGPFSALGTPPTNGFADDPVNTATGNFLEPETDLPFSGGAASLACTRMYNSLDARVGVFGVGWSSVFDVRLTLDEEGAGFVMADGRQVCFPRQGAGWDRGTGENFWLAEEPAGTLPLRREAAGAALVVRNNAGGWWAFSLAGVWLGSGNGPGTTVRVLREESGRVSGLVHEWGRSLTVEYAGDRVASVSASDGRRLEYLYDDERRLVGVQDAVGTRSYRWNSQGLVDRVVSAAGVVECENAYDDTGRVIQQVTAFGRTVRFAYLRGRVTSVSDDDGTRANTWVSDAKGRVVGVIDADGNRQSMAYDRHGNLVPVTERDGQTTVHAVDDRGRRTRTVTAEGADVVYGYDEHDRVTTVVTASGGTVEYAYASEGDRNPCRVTDPGGVVTELSWEEGVLTRVTDPLGATTRYEYGPHGELVTTIDPLGRAVTKQFDDLGNVSAVTLPDGDAWGTPMTRSPGCERSPTRPADWRRDYNATGQLAVTVDPTGVRTENTRVEQSDGSAELIGYDPCGRPVEVLDAEGGLTRILRDRAGRVIQVTTPAGRITRYGIRRFAYDEAGQLTATTTGLGGLTRYEYDTRGRMVRVTDPAGGVTTRTYTPLDKVATSTDPLGRTTAAEYDAAGRQVSQTDPDGVTTEWEHDAAGLVCALRVAGRLVSRIDRDPRSRTATITDHTHPGGDPVTHTLRYNRHDRLVERTTGGQRTRWEYDPDGHRTGMLAPGGDRTDYRHDTTGRVIEIARTGFGSVQYEYDADGRMLRAQAGDLLQTWEYRAGHPIRHTRITPDSAHTTTIARDEDDRITGIHRPDTRTDYRYNDACQLTAATTSSPGATTRATWTYDTAGRLIAETRDHSTRTHEYDAAGQLLTSTAGPQRTTFAYDGAGRRTHTTTGTRTTTGDRSTHYQWGDTGHLTGITEHTSDTTRKTRLWVNALGELAEVDGTASVWDTASPIPALTTFGETSVLHAPGGLTGLDGTWITPDWRDTHRQRR